MSSLPREVYSVEAIRRAERAGAAQLGIPMSSLMERAGLAALEDLTAQLGAGRRLLVMCGPGNNGGDGYVLAYHALMQGHQVTVCAPGGPPHGPGDAHGAYLRYVTLGAIESLVPDDVVAATDVIVDALFGSGLTRALDAPWLAAVEAINDTGLPVYAIDVPSGLDADSGRAPGSAVRATRTLALGALKPGYFLGVGPELTGMLGFEGLGLPRTAFEAPAVLERIVERETRLALPRRARLAHKGTNGHVLVVGAGPAMAGAARLAGLAALRVGAGLVTVAAHPSSVPIIAGGVPELICVGVEDPAALAVLAGRADVIAIGPGLGQSAWAAALIAAVLAGDTPCVIDADALNWLATQPPRSLPPSCLTPHPGEAVRLLAHDPGFTDTQAVQSDRLAAVTTLCSRYAATVVLKGAATLVASPGAITAVCGLGNPGMATAGAGDVLTGVIAGIAAQQPDRALEGGAALARAARSGVWIHACAGDRAAYAGERGLIASDLIGELRSLVNPAGAA